jgi:hypothetical protein
MTEEEAPKQTRIRTSREHSAAKPDVGSFPQPVRDISRHQLCARAQQPVPRNRIEQVSLLKRSVPYDTIFGGTRSGNPDFGSLSWRIRGFSGKRRPAQAQIPTPPWGAALKPGRRLVHSTQQAKSGATGQRSPAQTGDQIIGQSLHVRREGRGTTWASIASGPLREQDIDKAFHGCRRDRHLHHSFHHRCREVDPE